MRITQHHPPTTPLPRVLERGELPPGRQHFRRRSREAVPARGELPLRPPPSRGACHALFLSLALSHQEGPGQVQPSEGNALFMFGQIINLSSSDAAGRDWISVPSSQVSGCSLCDCSSALREAQITSLRYYRGAATPARRSHWMPPSRQASGLGKAALTTRGDMNLDIPGGWWSYGRCSRRSLASIDYSFAPGG